VLLVDLHNLNRVFVIGEAVFVLMVTGAAFGHAL